MSVPYAIALTNKLILGQPVMVKASEVEKNLVQSTTTVALGTAGARAGKENYFGNLHYNMTKVHLWQGCYICIMTGYREGGDVAEALKKLNGAAKYGLRVNCGMSVAAEYGLSKRARGHIDRAIDSGIQYMIIVGESEIAEGKINLRGLEASKEQLITREEMVKELKQKLNIM